MKSAEQSHDDIKKRVFATKNTLFFHDVHGDHEFVCEHAEIIAARIRLSMVEFYKTELEQFKAEMTALERVLR